MKKYKMVFLGAFLIVACFGCAAKYVYSPDELEAIFKTKLNMDPAEAKKFTPFLPSEKTKEMLNGISIKTSNVQSIGLNIMKIVVGEGGFSVVSKPVQDTTAIEVTVPREANPIEKINYFIAIARQVGLEAVYVDVTQQKGYDSDDYFNYQESHICAGIKSGDRIYLFDFVHNPKEYKKYRILNDLEAIATIMNLQGVYYDKEYLITGKEEFKGKAEYCYKAAITLSPGFTQAMNNLAVIYSRDKQYEEAEALLLNSLKIDDSVNVPRYNLAEIYLKQGDLEKATKLLIENAEKSFRDPYTNYRLGLIYFARKKNLEAEDCFKKAISFKRDYLEPRLSLISLLLITDRKKEAEALITDTEKLFPENEKVKQMREMFASKEEELPPDTAE